MLFLGQTGTPKGILHNHWMRLRAKWIVCSPNGIPTIYMRALAVDDARIYFQHTIVSFPAHELKGGSTVYLNAEIRRNGGTSRSCSVKR